VEKWGRNGEKCLWKRKQNVKKTGGFYDIVRVGIHGEVRHMMDHVFDGICAYFRDDPCDDRAWNRRVGEE
jgi:hypothetical protein